MHALFQIVENCVREVKNQVTPYFYGLLFHDGRKNCSSMGRSLNVPAKRIRKSFNNAQSKTEAIRKNLHSLSSKISLEGEIPVLAIDGTMLMKAFAQKIDHLALDYDGVIRRAARGLSLMVISLICGGNTIPLDFSFWENKTDKIKSKKRKSKKKNIRNSKYKTKIEMAIELITAWKDLVVFSYIAMDGAFLSEEMISFLGNNKLLYTMRAARNRKVIINGLQLKLSDQPSLKLIKNERSKSARGFYKGHACVFTAHKRKKRNGKWETFYIISNMELSAKDHVIAYLRRWPIDKSFRTMKQYLGLRDCQMQSGIKQTLHIFNVFMAYAVATTEKIFNGKKSVEEILNKWRAAKKSQNIFENNDSDVI
jgi:hypothetical protein